MPEYMLLLYAPQVDEVEQQEDRWADMPVWLEATESLRRAGLLVANSPLHPVASAIADDRLRLISPAATRR